MAVVGLKLMRFSVHIRKRSENSEKSRRDQLRAKPAGCLSLRHYQTLKGIWLRVAWFGVRLDERAWIACLKRPDILRFTF